ncbi:hypothetical protein ACHHYP_20274 [Achlya hypogyna]|uniref:Uncharacterized protein n=1 Tax=Achlya hypogyna TaxID=1202772 RepID=A0A1V9YTF6_ACHHY|nr:hypothetical protein ACHHYP_20274 [Achlya hypogyna]
MPKTQPKFTHSKRWTPEEDYLLRQLIDCFLAGILEDATGLTLRQYIARELRCDPLRVSKRLGRSRKLLGKPIGRCFHRRYYRPAVEWDTSFFDGWNKLKLARSQFEIAREDKRQRAFARKHNLPFPGRRAPKSVLRIEEMLTPAVDDDEGLAVGDNDCVITAFELLKT